MAKAKFHKSQRVYVRTLGTYALIERVIPHWVKGVDEPLRVTYDCGFGREFTADELFDESTLHGNELTGKDDVLVEKWRLYRKKNSFQGIQDVTHHPYPGTYPVITTEERNWGGWRVPGAEYNRDPARIEHQARMIVNAPEMVRILKGIIQIAQKERQSLPTAMLPYMKQVGQILRHVYDVAEKPDLDATEAAERDKSGPGQNGKQASGQQERARR